MTTVWLPSRPTMPAAVGPLLKSEQTSRSPTTTTDCGCKNAPPAWIMLSVVADTGRGSQEVDARAITATTASRRTTEAAVWPPRARVAATGLAALLGSAAGCVTARCVDG